jgi:hypothetical protein
MTLKALINFFCPGLEQQMLLDKYLIKKKDKLNMKGS